MPAERSSSWRRSSSPCMASRIRSTRVSSSARLVITAEVCGRSARPGEGGAALEVDQHEVQRLRGVRDRQAEHQGAQQLGLARAGGADHRPCGPMPSSAASLMSRLTGRPSAPTPIGTRSRSARRAAAQVRATSSWPRRRCPSARSGRSRWPSGSSRRRVRRAGTARRSARQPRGGRGARVSGRPRNGQPSLRLRPATDHALARDISDGPAAVGRPRRAQPRHVDRPDARCGSRRPAPGGAAVGPAAVQTRAR